MKRAALPTAALVMSGGIALAQADGTLAQLRDCSSLAEADRLSCLLAGAAVPPARPVPSDWTISRTTSPVDYAPIATATTSSREPAGSSAMQLSIRCRGRRTELLMVGPAIAGRGEDYVITYRVGSGQPEQVAASTPTVGAGVAMKGDPVALLRSLPGEGELAVRLSPRVGAAQESVFSLAGLDAVRAKMEAACRWPHADAKPHHSS
jgi:hypothetical protein